MFNVNIWGLSYFDDEPIPSSEHYDIRSVRESTKKVSLILDYLFTKKYSSHCVQVITLISIIDGKDRKLIGHNLVNKNPQFSGQS